MAFYDELTEVVGEKRVTGAVFFDLFNAFGTVPQSIPVSTLKRHGFDR